MTEGNCFMAEFTDIRVEYGGDGVAVAFIDVRARAVNVFTEGLAHDLEGLIRHLGAREDVKGVVIASGKAGGFMAGGDLKDFAMLHQRGLTAAQAADEYGLASRVLRLLERCGKPVAAAVNGTALGSGLELALACHYRVLADTPGVLVGLPDVTVGLIPGGGGTQRLPRLVGIDLALDLLLSGRGVGTAEALRLGIVDKVVPLGEVISAARAWVLQSGSAVAPWDGKGYRVPNSGAMAVKAGVWFGQRTAAVRRDTADLLPAPLAILSAVYEGTQLPIDRALAVENKYYGRSLVSVQARNLIRTRFLNRLTARKLVRRPKGVEVSQVQRLAVLGAGGCGVVIATAAVAAGIEVVLLDQSDEMARRGAAEVARAWAREREEGLCTSAEVEARTARLHPTDRVEDLAACDFVVDAGFGNLVDSTDLIARADAVMSARADAFVWAADASMLLTGGLLAHWTRPAQLIGLHLAPLAFGRELVEVITGPTTHAPTLARALDLIARMRLTPVVMHGDSMPFTARLVRAYVCEGMAMLAEGVCPAMIENAARLAGYDKGPLALADEIWLDARWLAAASRDLISGEDHVLPVHAQSVFAGMRELGRLDIGSAGGFYERRQDSERRLWAGLEAHFPFSDKPPDMAELKARLLAIQALEAVRCLACGVFCSPGDADLAATLGLSFPAWTGGPLSYIDTVGVEAFVAGCERFAQAHGTRFDPPPALREHMSLGQPFYSTSEK